MLSFSNPPQYNGGRAQTNVDFGAGYNDLWALDQMKQSQGIVPSSLSTATDWATLLDDNGFPTAMPAAGNWAVSEIYIHGVAGDVWVLDWTGTATINMGVSFIGGSLSASTISATRKEYTLTGSPTAADGTVGGPLKVSVTISAMSTALTSLRVFPKAHEALLDGSGSAESIFHPSFLSKSAGIGVLRFLNWTQANYSKAMKWDYMRSESDVTWMGPQIAASLYYGAGSKGSANNTYTVPNTLPSLVNGQAIQFTMSARPTRITPSAVSQGATTQFTATAHGLVNGDKVGFELFFAGGGSWNTACENKVTATGLPPTFTVTRDDADHFTIDLNSTGFAAPSTQQIIPRLTLTDGTTSKICYRQGLVNSSHSEWSAWTYPGTVFTAVYMSEFDCYLIGGDNNAQQLIPSAPVSAMVKLCNYLRCHPFFVFPYICEDNFWTQLATTVRATLTPGLIPRFESGNEIWNTGGSFWQTNVAQSVAMKAYALASAGNTATDLGYAKRFNEVCNVIQAVYGTGTDWQMILGCQLGGLTTNRLQGNSTINGGSSAGYPANKADYIATAPYSNILPCGSGSPLSGYPGALDQIDNYNQGGALRQVAFEWWLAEMLAPSTPGYGAGDGAIGGTLAYLINLANGHATTISNGGYTGRRGTGLKRTHYEGGPTQMTINFISSSGFPANAPTSGRSVTRANAQNFWADWAISDQAGRFMTAYLARMSAAGVEFPSQFTLSGVWDVTPGSSLPSNFGMWKANGYTSSSAIPMYTKFMEWNNGG